ncbi:hypothetical protein CEXT_381791 [Caerostris extrusa]|uniref:Uncharacterized protein n=1 Tax=Caerostris extrusa TaxID=172846 RepID=A0AAV4WFM9_CAEEX|nr:hypothetical protein CEXT_381791 [Caerostris extrusa]
MFSQDRMPSTEITCNKLFLQSPDGPGKDYLMRRLDLNSIRGLLSTVDLRAHFRIKLNLPKEPNAVPEFHTKGQIDMSLKCVKTEGVDQCVTVTRLFKIRTATL